MSTLPPKITRRAKTSSATFSRVRFFMLPIIIPFASRPHKSGTEPTQEAATFVVGQDGMTTIKLEVRFEQKNAVYSASLSKRRAVPAIPKTRPGVSLDSRGVSFLQTSTKRYISQFSAKTTGVDTKKGRRTLLVAALQTYSWALWLLLGIMVPHAGYQPLCQDPYANSTTGCFAASSMRFTKWPVNEPSTSATSSGVPWAMI